MNKQFLISDLHRNGDGSVMVVLQEVGAGGSLTIQLPVGDPLIAQLTIGRVINCVLTFAP
jgi:hypothetical protein